jgi:hypothetical protein
MPDSAGATAISTSRSSLLRDYPNRRSIACAARLSLCLPIGPKVSVFWTDRRFLLGRFPLLDRIDYLDHAVVLVEHECVRPARPSLEEIRHYPRGAPFAHWADRARSFVAADALEPKDRKEYLRTLLYPGRFYYSWTTGLIGSNDDAVAFISETHPQRLDVSLIARALQCRYRPRRTVPRTNGAAIPDRRMRRASRWFSERDPLDLKDAKALLSELSS